MFTSNSYNKKNAFTLAEVLITLGIIGVVAALTIPSLINNYKAKRLRSQFLKSYSTVQQVFKQMEADDVSLDPKTYTGLNSAFYRTFMNYLQGAMDCGSSGKGQKQGYPCYAIFVAAGATKDEPYKTFDGGTANESTFDDGEIALQDGTLLLFENNPNYTDPPILVSVDLNGYKNPPNRWGYDLFTFQFIDGELLTMGAQGTAYTDMGAYCNPNGGGILNGIACAQKAKDNTEYFKKLIKEFK